jgi:hypothetical protein
MVQQFHRRVRNTGILRLAPFRYVAPQVLRNRNPRRPPPFDDSAGSPRFAAGTRWCDGTSAGSNSGSNAARLMIGSVMAQSAGTR